MPQIDRNHEMTQLAVQMGGSLLFAQATEGHEIVVSKKKGAITITIRQEQEPNE